MLRAEPPSPVWHLDEVYTKIDGEMVYLWRAVDDEGTVLDVVVQRRRNTKAALRLLRKLLKNQGIKPTKIVTDRLGSYGAALKVLGLKHLQDVGGRQKEQSRRMFSRSNTKARTKITKVSIDKKRSKTALSPRSNLQPLQSSTPPHLPINTSKVQTSSKLRMELSDGIILRVKPQITEILAQCH